MPIAALLLFSTSALVPAADYCTGKYIQQTCPRARRLVLTAAVEERKELLLSALADLRRDASVSTRRAVLAAIADLESSALTSGTPSGSWRLVFSTQAAEPTQSARGNPAQPLIDATYAAFFKVAPALAGAQQDGVGDGASNTQILDLQNGRVKNTVRIPLPRLPVLIQQGASRPVLEIKVDGTVAAKGESTDLEVIFTESSFNVQRGRDNAPLGLRVPLPNPIGSVTTTFCDDNLRIARGGRGGVFVLKRIGDVDALG